VAEENSVPVVENKPPLSEMLQTNGQKRRGRAAMLSSGEEALTRGKEARPIAILAMSSPSQRTGR